MTTDEAEQDATERIFVYCGWNLCAEYDAETSGSPALSAVTAVRRTYTWGLDLSGSLQGAGGVGGLLAMEEHVFGTPDVYYPVYDANANVAAMIDSAGNNDAWYLREPFGKYWFGGGTYRQENPFQFSTKYFDQETGFYYYGYRYYEPETGRWASRDPIHEEGGLNLYDFCDNDGIAFFDFLGESPDEEGSGREELTDEERAGREWDREQRERKIRESPRVGFDQRLRRRCQS